MFNIFYLMINSFVLQNVSCIVHLCQTRAVFLPGVCSSSVSHMVALLLSAVRTVMLMACWGFSSQLMMINDLCFGPADPPWPFLLLLSGILLFNLCFECDGTELAEQSVSLQDPGPVIITLCSLLISVINVIEEEKAVNWAHLASWHHRIPYMEAERALVIGWRRCGGACDWL